MITPFRHTLRLLPLAGLLFLAACPQMTTGAISGAGTPLNATGEKTSSSSTTDTNKDSGPSDEPAPPPAAAPAPPPAGGGDAGGLGGAGSGSTEYSTMMRRVDGVPPEPEPVVADSRGGILSAPSSPEAVVTNFVDLRVVYWPSSERRTWTNAEDFFAKLAAGQISDDVADGAKVMHWSIMVTPLLERLPEDPPVLVRREEEVMDNGLVHESGYYLFFFTADGLLWDMGPPSADVTSAAQLKSLVRLDQADPEGHPYRIRFLGERNVLPTPVINIDITDPSLFKQPLFPRGLPSEFRPRLDR